MSERIRTRACSEFKTKIAPAGPTAPHARGAAAVGATPFRESSPPGFHPSVRSRWRGTPPHVRAFYREHSGWTGSPSATSNGRQLRSTCPCSRRTCSGGGDVRALIDRPPPSCSARRPGAAPARPPRRVAGPPTPAASLWWRADRWWGMHPDRRFGAPSIAARAPRGREVLHRLEWWPTRQILLDARGMDDGSMRSFAEAVARVRRRAPGLCRRAPRFAQFIRAMPARPGLRRGPSPSTASVLTPSKRAFIESRLARSGLRLLPQRRDPLDRRAVREAGTDCTSSATFAIDGGGGIQAGTAARRRAWGRRPRHRPAQPGVPHHPIPHRRSIGDPVGGSARAA